MQSFRNFRWVHESLEWCISQSKIGHKRRFVHQCFWGSSWKKKKKKLILIWEKSGRLWLAFNPLHFVNEIETVAKISESSNFAEDNIDWECGFRKIYSDWGAYKRDGGRRSRRCKKAGVQLPARGAKREDIEHRPRNNGVWWERRPSAAGEVRLK